jgi:hypothetical protein
MIDEHVLTPAIRRWLDESFATLPDPASIATRVRADVHETPQQRGWLPPPARGRFPSMLSATTFVVASAIVALVGGLLTSGILTTQPEDVGPIPIVGATMTPEATTTRPIELPTRIPKRFDSGRLDTPLGKVRWVHLNGDGEGLPEAITPIAVPGGFVSLDRGGTGFGPCAAGDVCETSATLWFSPDLLEWTQRPLPDDAKTAQLIRAAGSYWLLMSADWPAEDGSFDDPTLWRSSDALEWEPVDLGPIAPDGPDGIGWRPSFGVVASVGRTDAVAMTFEARTAASFLGLTGSDGADQWVSLVALGGGRYEAFGGYGAERGVIRFEPVDGGLRVIDDQTGAQLKELAGVDMSFIERWSTNGDPVKSASTGNPTMHIPIEHRIGVVVDGELTSVELPGSGPGGRSFGLVGSAEGFSAIQLRPDGSLQSWRSPDGVTWTAGEQVGDDPDEPHDVMGLSEGPEGLLALDPTQRIRWTTTDGVDWRSAGRGVRLGQTGRIGPGWLRLKGRVLDFYPDGGGKVLQVDLEPLRLKLDTKGGGFFSRDAISPNTFRYAVSEGVGSRWQRDQWIITFDDLPAGPAEQVSP